MLDPFNKRLLLQRLQKLQPSARAAFAAAISTRMISALQVGALTDPKLAIDALNCAWEFLLTEKQTVADCQNHLDILMNLLQELPDDASELHPDEEDSIAAVAYSLRSIISGNPEEPTWAAQRMFELVSRNLRSKGAFLQKGPELVKELVSQPLMQTEFSRQFEDLDELEHWSLEAGIRVRKRAEENQALP